MKSLTTFKKNYIAFKIMQKHKDHLKNVPNRTHPESTAHDYADKTGLPYDDLLKFYTEPCTLSIKQEGRIAFEILKFRIKNENITKDQLMKTVSWVDPDLPSYDKEKFCVLFFKN